MKTLPLKTLYRLALLASGQDQTQLDVFSSAPEPLLTPKAIWDSLSTDDCFDSDEYITSSQLFGVTDRLCYSLCYFSPHERTLILLKFWLGYSDDEIEEITSLSREELKEMGNEIKNKMSATSKIQ